MEAKEVCKDACYPAAFTTLTFPSPNSHRPRSNDPLRRWLLGTLAAVLCLHMAHAQTAPDTWWVRFTDKDATPYSLDAPEAFLSERAIQRRQAQGIALDGTDLPVDPAYIDAVLSTGEVSLRNRSTWFNAITIRTADEAALQAIASLPFVAEVRAAAKPIPTRRDSLKLEVVRGGGPRGGDAPYGASFMQIAMMNGHLLHDMDARGEGMLIGVLDSGFGAVDVMEGFSDLRDRGGVFYVRDMVEPGGNVYAEHDHGRYVLSCMAAVLEGQLVGTAPMADYVLVRTEDVGSEFLVEEDNWVSGAELCDSLGVDILNTSLGYTTFDWEEQDHTYADMDGATTRISIAGGMASAKGMIPVTSAGNKGETEWFHISTPADAIDILAVGAVDPNGLPAAFSSHGPSVDGRVKPDVAAMGFGTVVIDQEGSGIINGNGTSFSAPLVAGLVACLWQLHPERSATEVMDAVRQSASHHDAPESQLGYGIPDFLVAHQLLTSTGIQGNNAAAMAVFPVPFSEGFSLKLPSFGLQQEARISLYDAMGRLAWTGTLPLHQGVAQAGDGRLAALTPGIYVLRVEDMPQLRPLRLLKDR